MKRLLIIPHFDDELFISSFINTCDDIIIAFRGGGESKNEPNLTEQELFNKRYNETCSFLKNYKKYPMTLQIKRPIDVDELKTQLNDILPFYQSIITTHPYDKHNEHIVLGNMIKKLHNNVYGFIVNTQKLNEYKSKHKTQFINNLSNSEFKNKIEFSKIYKTQRHFLPNVVSRPEYKQEILWKLDKNE